MTVTAVRSWTPQRRAVALAFLSQGLVFISLTTRLPRIQDDFDLSSVQTSALLLVVVLAAGAGSVLSEAVARRRGSGLTLRSGLVGTALALLVIGPAPNVPVLVVGLAVYGVALGMVDATSNMQAVALEHRERHAILPSFHAAWTLGGIGGTLLTLATPDISLGVGALVLALLPLGVSTRPFLGHERGEALTAAEAVAVPWRRILLVGAAIVLFYMVDTASTTWGSIYFDDVLDSPSRLVALATLPYLVASLIARTLGDGLTDRYGAAPLLRGGAVVSAAGLAVVVLAPSWPVGIVGFFVLGLGVAVIAPLSFSAAAAIAREDAGEDPELLRARVDSVIARFNQFNYVGGLLGAVMTGVFGASTLRAGFAVPMVLILGILPLASAFAAER
ncbi:MFS transporter [Luteipulveratus halotolerans]|uniref:Major facilitator transporter n=1 Tax=Luteipulveratus halotolerans TaxID=1631356 RepID=A0A0L6CFQ0_9MICO|nr:MFS transporter [Luteipulveratus halotolerans]KNX36425.1 major facilitator transporter [Luteipulveratus halotolerans]